MHPIISKDYPEKKNNENAQTYHVEVAILIEHQILVTNLLGNV